MARVQISLTSCYGYLRILSGALSSIDGSGERDAIQLVEGYMESLLVWLLRRWPLLTSIKISHRN
ncbi:hypothetical protein M378DRAFT_154989 [Amanita muscaria Koide BX008]|uniref:Uncharacterized protein n=1 Tax=Amanita muscaria (strain Koide BX008) TaxID=946122 RepID=A0A0C2T613_AMAMK|nr:hypothetical protein M378DRAFT_154989 [Amanita muscaria Koide BX008]